MNQNKVLVKDQAVGNVFKCRGGAIHVNLRGLSLHFNELDFFSFARMVQEASSKLIDDSLKILIKDAE